MRSAVAAAAVLALTAPGCKKKPAHQDEVAPPEGGEVARQPAPARSGSPPAGDPLDEVRPTEPTLAGEPEPGAAPVPISEAGAPLYAADSDQDAPVVWNVKGADITFRTAEVGRGDDTVDIQITMESGGRSQLVTTCRGLDLAGGTGVAAAHQREGGVAFVTCTTGSGSEQRSWGTRLVLDDESGLVEPAGTFEMEGPPAIDTLDLGEGD